MVMVNILKDGDSSQDEDLFSQYQLSPLFLLMQFYSPYAKPSMYVLRNQNL